MQKVKPTDLAQFVKESEIQSAIKEYLELKGYFVFKNQQSALSYPGVPDLTAIKANTYAYIEVKKVNGSLSKDQQRFFSDIEPHLGPNVHCIVARSVDDVVRAGL